MTSLAKSATKGAARSGANKVAASAPPLACYFVPAQTGPLPACFR
jgi:hypothetical protein